MQYVGTLITFLPIILGVIIILAKVEFAVNWINKASEWAESTRKGLCEKERNIWRRVALVGVGGLYRLFTWTDGIGNTYLKSGIRLAVGLYFIQFFVFMVMYALLGIVMIVIVGFILFAILDNSSGGGTRVVSRGISVGRAIHRDRTGRSVGHSDSREGVCGDKITDHYDKSGKQTGHSETREGVFGDPVTDHYNGSGKQTGHGDTREGVFGDVITDEYDNSGNKIGHSVTRQGALGGIITDHYDTSGKHIGHTES